MRLSACFIGGSRYTQPLDPASARKFRMLATIAHIFVIGFSTDIKLRAFHESAQFYLLPQLPVSFFRYIILTVLSPLLALWCIYRYDVTILVAQSPYEGFAGALAKICARMLGRKVALIVESHGDFEEALFLYRRPLLPGLYRFIMKKVAGFSLSRADLLRAIADDTKRQLIQWAPDKTIYQFATWTEIDIFLEASPRNRTTSNHMVLYAGGLTPLKGVHHLVHAFDRIHDEFPEVRLVLVGPELNPGYTRDLKGLVAQIGLKKHISFMGVLSQTELAEKMREACVLVLPSLSEGLGRVLIEAMATGTPVIGSRVGGIPEIVEEAVTGFLVPPGDEAGLTDRIRWILKNPEDAFEMGLQARTFAAHFFTAENYVKHYEVLFTQAQASCGTSEGNHTSSVL